MSETVKVSELLYYTTSTVLFQGGKMKNPKGTGSVYRMKDKRRRKPWRAMSPNIKNVVTGKSERISLGMYETKQEALDALWEYNKTPYNVEVKKITFIQVVEKWKKEHYSKISDRRKMNIESRLNKMLPLYNLIFSEIKLIVLQNFFNTLAVSTGTKKEYRAVLNLIFEYGMKYDMILKNPVSYVNIGKHEKVREANIFNHEEISMLWKHQLLINVDTILILIYTGLRINELLELKKENVSIDERYIIAGSKTEAGKDRLIPLHRDLIPMIKRRYKESVEYLIEFKGKNIKYAAYRDIFSSLLETLNLNEHRVHDTRHTFATIINNTNANSTSIKNIIGHSDFKMTEKVYTHKDITELQKAIDLIDIKQG